MNVSESAKEAAVIAIFRRNHVTREYGRMLLSDISSEWASSGLRDGDLANAVVELIQSGILIHDEIDGVGVLELTPVGVAYLAGTRLGPSEVAEEVKNMITLNRTRRRKPAPLPAVLARRSGDASQAR